MVRVPSRARVGPPDIGQSTNEMCRLLCRNVSLAILAQPAETVEQHTTQELFGKSETRLL